VLSPSRLAERDVFHQPRSRDLQYCTSRGSKNKNPNGNCRTHTHTYTYFTSTTTPRNHIQAPCIPQQKTNIYLSADDCSITRADRRRVRVRRVSQMALPLSSPTPSSSSSSSFHTAPRSPMSITEESTPAADDSVRPKPGYRRSVPVNAEVKEHCHIYLDEQICLYHMPSGSSFADKSRSYCPGSTQRPRCYRCRPPRASR